MEGEVTQHNFCVWRRCFGTVFDNGYFCPCVLVGNYCKPRSNAAENDIALAFGKPLVKKAKGKLEAGNDYAVIPGKRLMSECTLAIFTLL